MLVTIDFAKHLRTNSRDIKKWPFAFRNDRNIGIKVCWSRIYLNVLFCFCFIICSISLCFRKKNIKGYRKYNSLGTSCLSYKLVTDLQGCIYSLVEFCIPRQTLESNLFIYWGLYNLHLNETCVATVFKGVLFVAVFAGFGFPKRVDKGRITTVKHLESWCLKR